MEKLLVSTLSKSYFCKIVSRSAGGGGRPGGKPAFSWREVKQLNLEKKFVDVKLRPEGFFEDIESHMDPTRGDKLIPMGDNFSEIPVDLRVNNRKTVNISKLFGSNKSYGILKERYRKQKFSYARVFGNRKKRTNINSELLSK